LAIAGRHPG